MTTPLKPPTTAAGRVSDTFFGGIVDELIADLPADLVFPTSNVTYSAMSREGRLSAILNGYDLQLRRAQWQLDGRACRPEVTVMVADDMGLPVAGDDEPRGARTRGVSWHEHLRAALLSLRFGCYGFAMKADTSSGRARLVGLFDRAPWTISRIHTDGTTGEFLGVTQDAMRLSDAPQIRAENMAWYCHERVGADWSGVSLLRSSWPFWVIKREMLKVHAEANRRWGLGIPVAQARPGTTPSGEQMRDAQQLASAARAGATAGAAMSPEFEMKIVGISGQLPDTLGFLNFLNREMAVACLMPHLELGATAVGSRSLGETFLDSWVDALGAIAAEICDVATRQIAARIVEWNFGPDEPVPTVRASGIGSRREVTAESLDMLLRSGALSSDPGLEAWVRREYRLPERETPPPAAVTPPPAPVAASRPRARKRKAPSQPTLFAAAEDPEPATDFAALQTQWEQAKAGLLAQWPTAAEPMVDDLTGQAEAAVQGDDLGALGTLVVSAAVLAALSALIGDAGVGLALEAAAGVVAEAAAQGVTVTAPDRAGEDRSRAAAEALAGVIAAGYATGAGRAALQVAGPDVDPAAVGEAVRAHLAELGTSGNGWVADNIGGALTSAQASGRASVMEAAEEAGLPIRYRISETLDVNTCAPCREADGREFDSLAEARTVVPAGNVACLGGMRCRAVLVPLWS